MIYRLKIVSKWGLWLVMYPGPSNSTETYFDDRSGFEIIIHNQSIVPFSKRNTFTASANMFTKIKIKRNFLNPYGHFLVDTSENSEFSSPYFDFIVRKLRVPYTQEY
jgi:hypothetical protein